MSGPEIQLKIAELNRDRDKLFTVIRRLGWKS